MGLRYSQAKYSSFRYGISDPGFQFKVQFSTKAGVVQAFVNNQIASLNWTFERMGGCGKFNLVLKRAYDDLTNLTASDRRQRYDFQVYITPSFGGVSTLYYRGYVTNIRPSLKDREQTIVTGFGYGERLKKIQVQDGTGAPKIYASSTVSGVVNSLITDFITPNTPITAGTIDTFSTAVTSIKFNGTVYEAIKKLADIVGAEFGVDKNREIYFRTPSTEVGFRFQKKKQIGRIDDEFDWSDIVNRVYIEGGDVDGVPFRFVKTDQSSKDNYELSEVRISNSSVTTQALAESLADSILLKKRELLRNTGIQLPFNTDLIETNIPLKLAVLVDDPKQVLFKYGTFKYGAQKYCGEETFKINRIDYELKDVSILTEIELNEGKPNFATQFETLNFELEQQRQAEGV